MSKIKKFTLVANLMFAIAFTISCSSDDGDNSRSGSSGGGIDDKEEVISTYIQISTSYDPDNGEIISSSETRGEYNYNNDGSKSLRTYLNGEEISRLRYEYDANGETAMIIHYDTNGNVAYDLKYEYITINSVEYVKRITENYYTEGNHISSHRDYDYDCNNDGSFCIITLTQYNAEGVASTTSAGQKCTFTTVNSKKLKASIISTDSKGVETGSKMEYEYDSRGNTIKTTQYRFKSDTNNYIKIFESVSQCTYIKI